MNDLTPVIITRVTTLLAKVMSNLRRVTRQQTTMLVSDNTTIAAGAFKEYDLWTATGGAVYGSCDFAGAAVTVRMLDENVVSPTHDAYVNAEAYITTALSGDRYLRLYNNSDAVVQVEVRCRVALDQSKLS